MVLVFGFHIPDDYKDNNGLVEIKDILYFSSGGLFPLLMPLNLLKEEANCHILNCCDTTEIGYIVDLTDSLILSIYIPFIVIYYNKRFKLDGMLEEGNYMRETTCSETEE